MLQRLPTVLAQVKTGNASENLLNEMWQIIYFFITSERNFQKSLELYSEFNKGIIQSRY